MTHSVNKQLRLQPALLTTRFVAYMIFTSSSSQNAKAIITVKIAKHHNLPQIIHFLTFTNIEKYR